MLVLRMLVLLLLMLLLMPVRFRSCKLVTSPSVFLTPWGSLRGVTEKKRARGIAECRVLTAHPDPGDQLVRGRTGC